VNRSARRAVVAATFLLAAAAAHAQTPDATFAPYGTAKVDMKQYPAVNAVFDVNYDDPQRLGILFGFVTNTRRALQGKTVIVTHGPEVRVFAKENYLKYQALVDRAAELSGEGVEFRMCNNALRAAGFKPEDMHGFITVVPAGFAELAYLQTQGYEYVNPIPLPVRDVRFLDQPQLRK
jgi:intracellular sulfur oxidation DsrE/DsrF family protein